MTKLICDVCGRECSRFHGHLYFEGVDYDLCRDCSGDLDDTLEKTKREATAEFIKNKKEKRE